MKRWRWRGDPEEEEQPDAGDVLQYTEGGRDWFHLVHCTRQVRGKAPHDLWLVVTRHDLVDGYGIPEEIHAAITGGARVFPAVRRR